MGEEGKDPLRRRAYQQVLTCEGAQEAVQEKAREGLKRMEAVPGFR